MKLRSQPANRPWRVLLGLLLIVLSTPSAARAAGADVRVVVDVSASMAESDPDNLRGQALGLLLRSLPDDGRAGVWTYGQHVNMLVKYGPSDRLWKETAAIQTRDLAARGLRSNLLAALDRATWDRAARSPHAPVHLVLLTDGHLDVSDDPAVNAAQRSELLGGLAGELAAAGIRVHTLALSERADVLLLEQLAALTHGYRGRMSDPGRLPDELLGLLGRMAGGARLSMSGRHTFLVDPGIRQLTVLRAGVPGDQGPTLVDPAGERWQRTTPRTRVRWHVDRDYELISIEAPTPGTWRLQDAAAVRVYAYGDLGIEYPDFPGTLFPDELHSFEFRVVSGAEPVEDDDFLELLNVEAVLRGPKGEAPLVVEPARPGGYRVHLLGIGDQGDYRLETRLWGSTFDHRLSLPFALRNPLTLQVRPAAEGFSLWAEVSAPELDYSTLRLAAVVRRPPAPARLLPLERHPAGLWKLPVTGVRGIVEVELNLDGKYLSNRELSVRTAPIRVILPVTEVQYVNLDLQGHPLLTTEIPQSVPEGSGGDRLEAAESRPPAALSGRTGPRVAAAASATSLPWWFAALAGIVNLALGLSFWWVAGARSGRIDLHAAAAQLRTLAGLPDPVPETAAEA